MSVLAPARSQWDLDELARASGLADWMFEQFVEAAHGRVIEVGPGIGTFSRRLLDAGVAELVLVEPDPRCADLLRQRFEKHPAVRIAVEALPGSRWLEDAAGSADFVLCQNVLEHIDDDERAMAAMAGALRPGGRIGLLVPAHPRLYCSLDRAYGHRRRYTREALADLVERVGLEIRAIRPFNALGIPGWWAKGRLEATRLGPRSLVAYELLLRLWRPVEDRLRLPWGLSLVVHAERPG